MCGGVGVVVVHVYAVGLGILVGVCMCAVLCWKLGGVMCVVPRSVVGLLWGMGVVVWCGWVQVGVVLCIGDGVGWGLMCVRE